MQKRIVAIVILFLTPSLVSTVSAQRRRRGPARADRATWAHDDKHVVLRGTWYDPLTWKKVATLPDPESPNGPSTNDATKRFRAALAAARGKKVVLASLARHRNRSTLPRAAVKAPGARSSADKSVVAAAVDGELWCWRTGDPAIKIAGDFSRIRHFEIAPNGASVSYIKGKDVYIAGTIEGSKPMRLTRDGDENTFNGELDWVYQEEVYGRYNFKGAWWAPDGQHLAFLRIEEHGVDTFHVIDHIPDQLAVERIKYPKSGRTNPRATLHVGSARDGTVRAIDLSKYSPEDEILIVKVDWTPAADRVMYMVQNREQTWLDLNFADPKTGRSRTIIHESCNDGWVNVTPMPLWLANGSFLWESERTGFRHYYRYDREGKLLATISKGNWTTKGLISIDERRGWMAFYGTTPDYALGRNAYVATLDGKKLTRVTEGRGNHRVSFNADGSLLLDAFNNLENPGEQWLRRADGTDVRRITKRSKPKNATFAKWVQIPARDGEKIDITYTLPRDFDDEKAYPVWINTYSGPNAPSVRDGWRRQSRGQWYVSLQVNVRSASGRGMKFTKACYRQFGVQELRDIEDAVDWLCEHSWADASRVGITGASYGGFMTAFAMTHSDKFKCGIAVSGVYDWKLYDTIYTERYMAKPQNNEAGYASTSCVDAAANLKGELLIMHGTMDDNVHMQNAIQFIGALQRANKQNFSFMIYPQARHGIRSPHGRTLQRKFMRKHL